MGHAPHSVDQDGPARQAPKAANDVAPRRRDVLQAARFTLLSLQNQSIGRIAMRYAHRVDMETSGIAYARSKECVYGPRFLKLHRFSQTFVMAHEAAHHMLGHIPQGAILYRNSPRTFNFKAYNIACDAVINAICAALPDEKTATSAGGVMYAVRRCQELGIIEWKALCEKMHRIARKGGVEPDPVFSKEITEVNSIQIYNAMMRTVRRRAAEKKEARVERTVEQMWSSLVNGLKRLAQAAAERPSITFATDPIELGAVDLHDALADLVRTYSASSEPVDHEGPEPVAVRSWTDLLEAVEGFVATASANALHAFTREPARRAHALSVDIGRILKAFDPNADGEGSERGEGEEDDGLSDTEESIIDQLADEMNAQDDLREAIEQASKKTESELNNDVARADSEMRRHQAGIDAGDALKKICPPGGRTATNWMAQLRRLMNTALVARMSYDERRSSRRTVQATYEATRPGRDRSNQIAIAHTPFVRRRTKATNAELIIDTSGSVFADRKLLGKFVQECETIAKTVNCRLRITFADVDVCETVDVGEAMHLIRTLIPRGGGGTDFRKAIAAAEARNPDAIVYMTDLCGVFPARKPRCPLIWAYPAEFASVKTPFGQRVQLAA